MHKPRPQKRLAASKKRLSVSPIQSCCAYGSTRTRPYVYSSQ